jgi:hypothetical protein
MSKTLYLFRRSLEQVDPALFLASESQGDVVLLEESGGQIFPYPGGRVFTLTTGHDQGDDDLTYDELVKKIFEYDHTVVI